VYGNGEICPQTVLKKYTTFSTEQIVALRSVNKIFPESYDIKYQVQVDIYNSLKSTNTKVYGCNIDNFNKYLVSNPNQYILRFVRLLIHVYCCFQTLIDEFEQRVQQCHTKGLEEGEIAVKASQASQAVSQAKGKSRSKGSKTPAKGKTPGKP
jgi:hypothetical protein